MSAENSLPKQLWRRYWWVRVLRALGWCIIILAVLYNAFRAEENWRGERAWLVCQRDLQSRGENLSWEKIVPPPVPDRRNLAMAPFFVRELRYQADPKTGTYTFGPTADSPGGLKDMPFGGAKPDYILASGAEMARPTDLPGFARYFRENKDFPHNDQPGTPEADILKALSRYDPALDELAREIAARPLTRYPLDWYREDISRMRLPHLYLEQGLVSTLRLRAAARLAAGREEDAMADLDLCWRLCHDANTEQILIGALEQEATLRLTLCTVWDGLASRRWSPSSLRRLQNALKRFEPLKFYPDVMRHERLYTLKIADYLGKRGDAWLLYDPFSRIDKPLSTRERWTLRSVDGLVPTGWYDLNKALNASWLQEYVLGSVDPAKHRVFPDKLARGVKSIDDLPKKPTNVFAKFSVGLFESTVRHAARIQSILDQAVLACALERFFVDRGTYPARLDELVPAYLTTVPNDVIGGDPIHYRTTPDGRFQIYGIGWNGLDESGQVAWKASGKLNEGKGDWVWQYAALDLPPPTSAKTK